MLRLISLAALAAGLVTADAAAARPSVTTDRACYAAGGDVMQFSGQGFTPGAQVAMIFAHNGKLGSFTAQTDAAGAFTTKLRAPELKDFDEQDGAFDLDYTANDQSKFGPDGPIGPPEEGVALGSVRISDWSLDIAAWNGSARATRGQRVKLVTTGWTSAGDTLFVHYLRGGKVVRSERVGALRGPCGDLKASPKLFTFQAARPGTYAVRFSATPKWDAKAPWLAYLRVRLAA